MCSWFRCLRRLRRLPSCAICARCISAGSGPVNLLVSLRECDRACWATGDGIATGICVAPALLIYGPVSGSVAARLGSGCPELGREFGPLEPLVHVLARCGRFSRVLGSVGRPILKRGVLGLSSSPSSRRCILPPGCLLEDRAGRVPGSRLGRDRESSCISGCVDGPAKACCSISGPFEDRPRLRKSILEGRS